ncbi:MAG: hypothetical protein Q7J16_02855 [Candidatus Cloacimonadales bacterium]|nr:hypothetical protein [Candidatus Cloacimonadales bacterium]
MIYKLIHLIIFICVCSFLIGTTYHIKLDGTGDFTTIQEGIDASSDADTVLVYPGTYFENLNMTGKNITLASLEMITSDPQYIISTIIDGQRQESCIILHNIDIGVTIRGFTIQNGYGTYLSAHDGGGIQIQCVENGIIMNCHFQYNLAEQGGAIFADLTTLTLSGLRINENYANYGGAAFWDYGSNLTFDPVNRCDIYNNNASKGADFFAKNTGNIHVVVDTFSVLSTHMSSSLQTFIESEKYSIIHYYNSKYSNDYYEVIPESTSFSITGLGIQSGSLIPSGFQDRLVFVSGSLQGWHVLAENSNRISSSFSYGSLIKIETFL